MSSLPSSLPVLRSERLLLRPVVGGDLDLLAELNSDPVVMAHIRGRPATSVETCDEWRERLTNRSDPTRGLGYWLGLIDGEFVGWWSASHFRGREAISGVGYRLRREWWGRGVATEGARVMIEQAFSVPSVATVVASTSAANTASRRVLEKVGLTLVEQAGTAHVRYELTRENWARKLS